MTRRGFLARIAAAVGGAVIAKPTLEEIERFTWRRRLFPGWSPPSRLPFEPAEYSRAVLKVLEKNLQLARVVNREYAAFFEGDEWSPRIRQTLYVRQPDRFSFPDKPLIPNRIATFD